MTTARLKLMDLVRGLERFGDRYHAIDVFADDVEEVRTGAAVQGLQALDQEGRRYRLTVPGGKVYELELFATSGVVRLSRAQEGAASTSESTVLGGLIGGAAGAAVGSALSKKGEWAAAGLVLGLLAGAALGGSTEVDAPRRVFTMSFDPNTRQWRVYDGGLVPWMKEQFRQRPA